MATGEKDEAVFPWHEGVCDAHCHPTDTMSCVPDIPNMKAKVLTIMATRAQDQELVADVARQMSIGSSSKSYSAFLATSCRVVPCFGWHPWFSHQLFDDRDKTCTPNKPEHYRSMFATQTVEEDFLETLPDPRPLTAYLSDLRRRLEQFPLALVGEVGLDRTFRVPDARSPSLQDPDELVMTAGSREGRRLSPFRVSMEHQRCILRAQLDVAAVLGRAVSVHGVAAHGVLFETLQETWKGHERPVISKRTQKRRASAPDAHGGDGTEEEEEEETAKSIPSPIRSNFHPPRICLHSYSGPPELVKQYCHPSIPSAVFFSFSEVINFSHPASNKAEAAVLAVPEDRLLVESDLHIAGDRMDAVLEQVVRRICSIRNWQLSDGVRILRHNWEHFVLGNDHSKT